MKYRLFIFGLFALYITSATVLMIWQGIGIAPDRYILILLLGSVLIKKTRQFLLDWLPFLLILISYDFLRGFVPILNKNIHYLELIKADQWIFGIVPTTAFQTLFFQGKSLKWYDFLATIFYFLHFALPLAFGFLLWVYHKSSFQKFVLAISLLSYTAWLTFLVFPSAPPWLAGEKGYLPGVVKVLDFTLSAFPTTYELPTVYHQINPNPVAALPSMHGAYPFLVFLFALQLFKWKSLLFFPYLVLVWLSMVYLGEHYVIDLLVGACYALVFYLLTGKIFSWLEKKKLY